MVKASHLIVAFFAHISVVFANHADTEHTWVNVGPGLPYPRNVVEGGFWTNGTHGYSVFVARLNFFEEGFCPAYVRLDLLHIFFNTPSNSYTGVNLNHDLLVSTDEFEYKWVNSHSALHDMGVVAAGTSATYDLKFICRAFTPKGLIPGNLDMFRNGCAVNGEGLVFSVYDKYQVLVGVRKSGSGA
ncbi:uncharacterized protein [Drosophila takahashii]|uniref:uncharacterized protein n=1 Tax=Drosophila takahashii TaxID=29030 RepID=UPI0007E6D28E|nr:uncharacterized protein LOC108069482 [Drosophila takahashii]